MPYRIFRHPSLEQDLFDIADWIVDYAGVDAAERTIAEIEDKILILADTPHIGSLRSDIYQGLRAISVGRKGVVTFVVDEDERTVLIVSVTYASADWVGRMRSKKTE